MNDVMTVTELYEKNEKENDCEDEKTKEFQAAREEGEGGGTRQRYETESEFELKGL